MPSNKGKDWKKMIDGLKEEEKRSLLDFVLDDETGEVTSIPHEEWMIRVKELNKNKPSLDELVNKQIAAYEKEVQEVRQPLSNLIAKQRLENKIAFDKEMESEKALDDLIRELSRDPFELWNFIVAHTTPETTDEEIDDKVRELRGSLYELRLFVTEVLSEDN